MSMGTSWRFGLGSSKYSTRLAIALVVLLFYFFLVISSLVGDSPTMDEQNHIARGLAFLQTGDPRLSLEHPPLINSLSALPLLTMPELRLPIDHPSWERREGWYEFADLFLWQYNHDVNRIVFLARLPIVFLAIALALVGYHFARRLWGITAALPALILFLFEPNLMAHGRYATTDIGGTLFTFLATFMLWRLWQNPGRWHWRRWLVAAVCMGLAFGSKLSAVGFVLIWAVLAVLPIYPDRDGQRFKSALIRLAQLMTAGVVSILVVWSFFGFQWGPNQFVTDMLEPLNRFSGPMPTFWAGLEQIALLGGGGRIVAFLFGRFSESGWAVYFPAAFLVKTPIILIVLILIAVILLLENKLTRRYAAFLIVTSVAFYILSMQSALNIGYRHVLPALPYMLLLISGLATPALNTARQSWFSPARVLTAGLVVTMLVALWIHPNYLSYFNLAAGGPANGYRVLTDSNVDWGQDLLRLKSWMAKNDIERVELGWFGSADPDYYGIPYNPLPGLGRDRFFRLWWEPPFDPVSPQPGIYAISASSLWEPPLQLDEKRVYAWFREREPDDRIGYSILIYDVR